MPVCPSPPVEDAARAALHAQLNDLLLEEARQRRLAKAAERRGRHEDANPGNLAMRRAASDARRPADVPALR